MTTEIKAATAIEKRPRGGGAPRTNWLAIALAISAFGVAAPAVARVAGSTIVGVSVVEAKRVAMGWSVKKGILGKTVYNDSGEKVGKVDDLIIAPDQEVSYLIIAAGGFIGIGRHDVAIPVAQVKDIGGRLIIPGASKAIVEAMPPFAYADDTARRDQFIADAEHEITAAKASVADLEKKFVGATTDAKARLDLQMAGLQKDVKSAEEKVAEMNHAATNRWHEFEGGVNTATTRLHKAVEALRG
jgi:sporulation protein YlmC with PRC-barrel domain